MPAERCNKCRFWLEDMSNRDPHDADWGFGSCRREPPRLVEVIVKPLMPALAYGQQTDPDMMPLDLVSASRFPATSAIDWCGRYEAVADEVAA
ncbi:hypothetical protein [Sphingomonas sp. Leaf242]|uniref:hypothetical protein n=1 Tax=Sphingomonas sp. Leaf242 TaxID=1736304 RepID=UPI0012E18CB3|nr:hypothetical protein [Sphingomonas sp. Leaf242]